MSFYGSNWSVFIEDVERDACKAKTYRQQIEERIHDCNARHTAKVGDTIDDLFVYLIKHMKMDRHAVFEAFDAWRRDIRILSGTIGYTVPCLWQLWAEAAKDGIETGDSLSEAWESFKGTASEADF